MKKFVASLPPSDVSVEGRVIEATTGFAACDFAEAMEAYLLVLPGHNRPGDRMPPMTDWALQVVPCNLRIVHRGPAWGLPSEKGARASRCLVLR